MPLATVDDLEARLGEAVADVTRAEALLTDASAAVVAYTGQSFVASTSTVRLRARNGTVRLPQAPVTAVAEVTDVDGNEVSHRWDHGPTLALTGYGSNIPWDVEPWRTSRPWVDVTYTHGYEEVPSDIVAVVCQMAGRALGSSPAESGTVSETIDGYSYRLGSAAAAGGVGMLPDERAVLDRYRTPIGMIRAGT